MSDQEPQRTREQILQELEALILEYAVTDTDIQSPILTGFVLKASFQDIMDAPSKGGFGNMIWLCPEDQNIFMSIGLSDALSTDVQRHYDYLYDNAFNRSEDDDE